MACYVLFANRPLPEDVREISGLAPAADGTSWWALNDSGNEPVLYRLDDRGHVRQRVRVSGETNVDWEDLAAGPCPTRPGRCLIVGDIGDNLRRRSAVRLVFVPEPRPSDSTATAVATWTFRYADGPRDAEALLVHPRSGEVIVVTKGRQADIAMYRVPPGGGVAVRLTTIRTGPVPIEDQVTGAGIDPTGRHVALRTYRELWLASWSDALDGRWRPISLEPLAEGQGESVAVRGDGELRLASEAGALGLPATWSALRCPWPTDSASASSPASAASSRTFRGKSSPAASEDLPSPWP